MNKYKQKEWANLISQCLAFIEQADVDTVRDLFSDQPLPLPDMKEEGITHYAYIMRTQFGSSGPSDGFTWKPSQGARVAGNGKSMKRYFYHKSEDMHIKKQVFWNISSPQWTWLDYRVSEAPSLVDPETVSSPKGVDLKKLIEKVVASEQTGGNKVQATQNKRTTRVTKKPEQPALQCKRDSNGNQIFQSNNDPQSNAPSSPLSSGSSSSGVSASTSSGSGMLSLAEVATSAIVGPALMQPLPYPRQMYRPAANQYSEGEGTFDPSADPAQSFDPITFGTLAPEYEYAPSHFSQQTSDLTKSPLSHYHTSDLAKSPLSHYHTSDLAKSPLSHYHTSDLAKSPLSHYHTSDLAKSPLSQSYLYDEVENYLNSDTGLYSQEPSYASILSPPMSPSHESGFSWMTKRTKTESESHNPFFKIQPESGFSTFTPASMFSSAPTASSFFETASNFLSIPVEFLTDKICHSLCTNLIFKRDFFLRTGIESASLLEKVKQQTHAVDPAEFPFSMIQTFFNWLGELASSTYVPQHHCLICGQTGSHNQEAHTSFWSEIDTLLVGLRNQSQFNFYECVKQLLTWLLRNPSQHKVFQDLISSKLHCPFCACTNGNHDLQKHQRWKEIYGITTPPPVTKEESLNPEDYSQKAFEWIVGRNWELPMYIAQALLSLNYFKSFVNCLEVIWKAIYLV